MLMGVVSDIFPLCGYKRKSYLFLLSLIEILNYSACFFIISSKSNYIYLAASNMIAKITNAWRGAIVRKLKSEHDREPQRAVRDAGLPDNHQEFQQILFAVFPVQVLWEDFELFDHFTGP